MLRYGNMEIVKEVKFRYSVRLLMLLEVQLTDLTVWKEGSWLLQVDLRQLVESSNID